MFAAIGSRSFRRIVRAEAVIVVGFGVRRRHTAAFGMGGVQIRGVPARIQRQTSGLNMRDGSGKIGKSMQRSMRSEK